MKIGCEQDKIIPSLERTAFLSGVAGSAGLIGVADDEPDYITLEETCLN